MSALIERTPLQVCTRCEFRSRLIVDGLCFGCRQDARLIASWHAARGPVPGWYQRIIEGAFRWLFGTQRGIR